MNGLCVAVHSRLALFNFKNRVLYDFCQNENPLVTDRPSTRSPGFWMLFENRDPNFQKVKSSENKFSENLYSRLAKYSF